MLNKIIKKSIIILQKKKRMKIMKIPLIKLNNFFLRFKNKLYIIFILFLFYT